MTLRLAVWIAIGATIAAAQSPRKLTQAEAVAAAVAKPQPAYPDLARQLKITGAVSLDVVIAETGAVESVTPVSGNPVLTRPAAEALKKWKFKPFLQDGNAVKAEVTMKVDFFGK